jgi:ABC-2 type transport system ATP-binding protein
LRHIYRIPSERYDRNLATFSGVLELAPFIETPVRQLSLGQRMRGDLAAALLHDPEILFLDEPTIGLDIVAKARIRDFLADVNRERGVTVLLTTHDMDDIERLCKRMLIIDQGRVIYDGDLDTVKQRFGGESVLVVDLEEAGPPIEVDGAKVTRVDGPRQWLTFRREDHSAADLVAAVASKVALRDLTLEEPAIEDVVRRIYERGISG